MIINNSNINSINDWADFWHYEVGVNVIPADTKNKQTYENWTQWQNTPIPDELHEQRKKNGDYKKGIAIVTGPIWRGKNKGKYLNGIDCDNKKAIEEICNKDGNTIPLEELAKWTIVEQHKDNPDKAHIYIMSIRPFKNKSSTAINQKLVNDINNNDIPAIEVKCEKHIMFCTPSIHKNGYPYEIINCKIPSLCDELEYHLNNIFKNYGKPYLESNSPTDRNNSYSSLIPIDELFKPKTKILEGQNRHEAILRISESLIQRNKKILSLEKIKELAYEWNQQHCKPPLDEKEFERQWNDALKFVSKSKIENENSYNNNAENNPEINLVEIAKQNCNELFIDQYNTPYACIKIKGHLEVLSLNGKRFRNLLFRICYNHTKKISSEKIEGITNILKADAEISENIKHLDLRVGKTDDYTFLYDLTNSKWSVIRITPSGWFIIDNNVPIIFKRYAQQPQVNPSLQYSDDIFDKFLDLVNVQDEDTRLLLKCYIISLFIPDMAKPILMIHGEQGSAKSTLQELIKMLVDPSIVRTLTFPRDINELVQQLSHNYVAYYDNVSDIKEWISNVFCRASTGSGFTKRQLYTDDDDIIYNFKRCIGINGINLGATKADLLDRGIIIQLERIPKERRRKLDDIWKDFEVLRPQLLGCILDILVKVLQVKQKGGIKISNGLNRMADFEEYAESISRCMGYQEGEFLRVYQDNIGIQIDEAIQANPLSIAVMELMDDTASELDKTPTELHLQLNGVAETKLNINIQKIKPWPKSPNQLSRRLTEAQATLREKGIVIEKYKDEKGHRKIKIRKVSSISPYRQEPLFQPQNPNKSLDDTLDDTKEVSSNKNYENHEQNNGFGRFDGVDDTLHIKVKEHLVNGKTLKCHHKSCEDKEYKSLEEYKNHCFSRHPKQPMYPELSLIKLMELEPKGNPWES
jgi:hypothetical protein